MAVSNITLAKLNDIINQDMEILEKKAISSLIVNKPYIIKQLLMLSTRFGKAILVTLFDENANTTFKSFLPKRVTEYLNEETINKMNLSDSRYALTYLGQSSPMFPGAKTRSLIKFELID